MTERRSAATPNSNIKSVYHNLFISILLIFPAILFYARLFYPNQSLFMIPDFGESDVLHFHLPLKEILSSSLNSHEWPLWTPYIANGFPVLAEGQIGTFYIPNLILFRFLPTFTAYNLNLLISFILLSFGTFALLRMMKFCPSASLYGSWIFTFSGYFSVHLNHFDIIQTASLIPFIYWSFIKLLKYPNIRNSVLFAILLNQQIFAGYINIVFISLVGEFIIFLFFMHSVRALGKRRLLKNIFYILFGFLVSFLLSSIQLFPTLEIWKLSSKRNGLEFDTVTAFPYPLKHMLSFINPYYFGSPKDATYPPFSDSWGIFWENTAYIGIFPLILSFLSLIFFRNKITKLGFLMIIISLLLCLGKYSPVYFLYSFPPFNFFRVPSKFLLLTALGLTLLSVVVFDKILDHLHKINTKFTIIFLIVFSIIFLADEFKFSYQYPPVSDLKLWNNQPVTISKINDINNRIIALKSGTDWNKVFLTTGWTNISPYVFFENYLAPNFNIFARISTPDLNMGGLIPIRTATWLDALRSDELSMDTKIATLSSFTKHSYQLQSVGNILTSLLINDPELTETDSIKPPNNLPHLEPIRIYRLNNSLPRVYFASETSEVKTIEDFFRKLADKNYDVNTALVENEELTGITNRKVNGSARISSEKNTEINLESVSDSPALLVMTDSNYPGWNVSVNGKLQRIYTVNLTQRAVIIPKGKNSVKFWFSSKSFDIGKLITLITWITVCSVVFLSCAVHPRKDFYNNQLSSHL